MARDVASDRLGVDDEEPDLAEWQASEVDDSDPSALAHAGPSPSHLAAAATAGDDIACLRVASDPYAKGGALFFSPQFFRVFDEGRRFCDGVHEREMYVKDVLCATQLLIGGYRLHAGFLKLQVRNEVFSSCG